ncbi:MAG: hypothetical protein BroJett040_11720 [Oligoflexia bacterium]|nr:MAG: hypothetical protein BroJett040_11720 [Oligoflexia bacterium]
MSDDPSNYIRDYEKVLVAEQPGLTLSLAGLFVALFIGLVVQFVFSPQRLKPLILQAAQKIHPEFRVTIEDVSVSLADGIFPELAIVVRNISMESPQKCFMSPVIEVNQIKLPLSFRNLLAGEIYIHEVYADQMSLSIRSEYVNCSSNETAILTPEITSDPKVRKPSAQSVGRTEEFSWADLPRAKNSIDTLKIQSLRVHYLPVAFTSFEIQNLSVQLKSQDPRSIQIKGKLNLGGETLSGDYSSQANLSVNYEEIQSPDWNIHLNGNWREGNYTLQAKFDSRKNEMDSNLEMKHIPLSQLFPLLKKYKLMSSEFNGKQIWVSMKSNLQGHVGPQNHPPLRIDYVKIEGDVGDIEARDIKIESYEPLKYEPIKIDIHSLNFDRLFIFLNRQHPTNTLSSLGTLHGQATFRNANDIELKAEHTGLEFVFSSRGVRQIQSIGLISGEMKFSKDRWRMKIDRIKPVEGIFLGDIQMTADRDWNDVQIKARLDDLTLGPGVQKLMTLGGEIGAISGEMSFDFQNGDIHSLQGSLQASNLTVDEIKTKKAKFAIQTLGRDFIIDARAQGISLPVKSAALQVLLPVYKELKSSQSEADKIDIFEVTGLSAKIKTERLENFYWKDMSAQFLHGIIKSQGGWDHHGQLQGFLDLKYQGLNHQYLNHQWMLTGHRDRPQFIRNEK